MDVESLVFEYIFNKFKLEAVLSTSLDFVEDSVDRVEMLFELEELFGVRLSEDDVLSLETVGDVCTKIKQLRG